MRILLSVFILLSFPSFACMNEFEIIPGISRQESSAYQLYRPQVYRSKLEDYAAKASATCKMDSTCNDLIIAYIYLNDYNKALELSTKLVRKFPSVYEIVMSHAAALELNGKPQEALKYIRIGMNIDPDSHYRSEWIHVKILEDQISGKHTNILGYDFGNGPQPVAPTDLNTMRLMTELHYQLTERILFIPQPDAQFAALLHDYADILYLNNYKTISQEYYRMAYDYGFRNSPRVKYVNPRKAREEMGNSQSLSRIFRGEQDRYDQQREKDRNAVLISIAVILMIAGAASVMNKNNKK